MFIFTQLLQLFSLMDGNLYGLWYSCEKAVLISTDMQYVVFQ